MLKLLKLLWSLVIAVPVAAVIYVLLAFGAANALHSGWSSTGIQVYLRAVYVVPLACGIAACWITYRAIR